MRILVFGDSVSYGAWDINGGWVDRLKRDFHKKTVESAGETKIQLLNLGISGDNSGKILKRLRHEIEARRSNHLALSLVFSFGTNDSRSNNNNLPEIDIENFISNTNKIIHIAKTYTNKILFVGNAPLNLSRVSLNGKDYSDKMIETFDEHLRNLVNKKGIVFIPLRAEFMKHESDELFTYDNLHPNETGHQLILNLVKPELDKLIKD